MYRLSEHSFAIEKGRRRQTWLSRKDRLCAHCPQTEVETELHFLTSCPMYDHVRDTYFPQITQIHNGFEKKPDFDRLPYLLGEIPQCDIIAAKICDLLPQEKVNQWRTNTIVNTTHIYAYLFSLLYFNHLYIVTTLYIHIIWFVMSLFFWNFCECNVYCSFLWFISLLYIIYFTCFGNVNICFPCQ